MRTSAPNTPPKSRAAASASPAGRSHQEIGGVAAPLRKISRSLHSGADGVVPKPKRFGLGTTPRATATASQWRCPPNLGGLLAFGPLLFPALLLFLEIVVMPLAAQEPQ